MSKNLRISFYILLPLSFWMLSGLFVEEIVVEEEDLPLTEDTFWEEYYDIGNCELDSTIVEMETQKIINI